MEGTVHQTRYGWIVRYVKSNINIIHYPVHPDDQKYLFDKDHGSEVIFDTELCEDTQHRPLSEDFKRTYMTARIIGAMDSYTPLTNPKEESMSERLDRIEKKSKQYDEMLDDLLIKVYMNKATTKIREKELTEIDQIYQMLVEASTHALEAEVVMSALTSMKKDRKQSVIQAMRSGMNEWVK